MKISQSLVKSFLAYMQKKECGLQIQARYFDGIVFPESEAQAKGKYLEYLCTGSPDRYGNFPTAQYTAAGSLTEEYRKLFIQAQNYHKAMKHYDIEILDTNVFLEFEKFTGIADIIARYKNKDIIIDIKSSALLYNKWSEYGWLEESLPYKQNLLMQAVHYPWLVSKIYGEQMGFHYWVFSTKIESEFELFNIILEPDRMDIHETWIRNVADAIVLEQTIGWTAHPSVAKCNSCPLKTTCKSFIEVPQIKTIYLPNN